MLLKSRFSRKSATITQPASQISAIMASTHDHEMLAVWMFSLPYDDHVAIAIKVHRVATAPRMTLVQ